jgi:hypothetical protein
LLTVLAEKPCAVAPGEIEAMGLLRGGLIENAQTFESHSFLSQDVATGALLRDDQVLSFKARLADKGHDLFRHENQIRTFCLILYDEANLSCSFWK